MQLRHAVGVSAVPTHTDGAVAKFSRVTLNQPFLSHLSFKVPSSKIKGWD